MDTQHSKYTADDLKRFGSGVDPVDLINAKHGHHAGRNTQPPKTGNGPLVAAAVVVLLINGFLFGYTIQTSGMSWFFGPGFVVTAILGLLSLVAVGILANTISKT